MSKILLDRDPVTRTNEWFIPGDKPGSFSIQTVQDVEPILERNKALQNESDKGWSRSREWRRAASIPNVVALQWMKQYGVNIWDKNHARAVKRLLNSSEWRWLRTAPGKL